MAVRGDGVLDCRQARIEQFPQDTRIDPGARCNVHSHHRSFGIKIVELLAILSLSGLVSAVVGNLTLLICGRKCSHMNLHDSRLIGIASEPFSAVAEGCARLSGSETVVKGSWRQEHGEGS